MKILSFILTFAVVLLLFSFPSESCVGRMLYIGVVESPIENLFADMYLVLISERTGTTVNLKYYRNTKELYDAVKNGEIGILLESTDRALGMLGKPIPQELRTAYDISREQFRNEYNLVWLEPFGTMPSDGERQQYYSPVVTIEVLRDFPALPGVINKLAGVMNEATSAKLMASVNAGQKSRKVAREFLKEKKLI